jgi:hypothetical protein
MGIAGSGSGVMSASHHTMGAPLTSYKVMYLAGWLIFDNGCPTFRGAHKVCCDSEPSARALAAMYNRVLS